MNDQQLEQVMGAVNEATVFAPGESGQLVPATSREAQVKQECNSVIESASKLASDMLAIYQQRVVEAQARLAAAQKIADGLVTSAHKTAHEVEELYRRDCAVGVGIARVLTENGIEFEGEI